MQETITFVEYPHAKLALHLSEVHGDAVLSQIELFAAGEYEIRFPCLLLGYDVLAFVNELTRMYDSLEGMARLIGTDGDVEIRLTVVNRAHGRITIGGRLGDPVKTDVPLETRAFGNSIEVAFGGLETDQSYLPEIVRGLKKFLAESGISVENPWGEVQQ